MIDSAADVQGSANEGYALVGDSDECAAAESGKEIVDEILPTSPMKNRSKSRKIMLPEPLLCSEFEDAMPRLQHSKHNHASPGALRAGGHAKYFCRNSNQFPSVARKKRMVRKGRAGNWYGWYGPK